MLFPLKFATALFYGQAQDKVSVKAFIAHPQSGVRSFSEGPWEAFKSPRDHDPLALIDFHGMTQCLPIKKSNSTIEWPSTCEADWRSRQWRLLQLAEHG